MDSLVVVGAQWGDEGKGKIVDLLAENVDFVVRFGGGSNAGHTLVTEGRKLVLHQIPSGVLHRGKCVVLGDGMVIDADRLLGEVAQLREAAVAIDESNLRVSDKAHLILPYHRQLDELREQTAEALGTTRRGVGPAYEDKVGRRGVRVGDLLRPSRLRRLLEIAFEEASFKIRHLGGEPSPFEPLLEQLLAQGSLLAPYITDTALLLHQAASRGARLLFEGAQGILLDLDHGTYPYVTSSSTVPGGACAGSGLGPRHLQMTMGVAKAYLTRVGAGPFPTELTGEPGPRLRAAGQEYGATTGRPRRCGWLDLPALRYAARIGGLDALALTKLDVLAGLHPLRVCVGYRLGQRSFADLPSDAEDLLAAEPLWQEVSGFEGDLGQARAFDELPPAAQRYVELIEQHVGLPIRWVSVGPERHQTLERRALDPAHG